MTEPSNELDRRAARAADDLRGVAASRPRPSLNPDRHFASPDAPASSRIPRLLAVAAVLALVAGAAVVLWPRDEPTENIVAGPVGEIPAHILDPVPDGFTAMGMNREDWGSDEGEESYMETITIEQQPWHLYGPAGERAELAVIVAAEGFDVSRPTWGDDGEIEIFDLAGRRAYRDEEDLGAFGSNAVVVEVDDRAVAVFGGVGTEVVDAVAATVTVADGEPVVDPDSLPEGWEAGEIVDPTNLGFTYRNPSVSKVVFYMTEELEPTGPGFTMIEVVTGTGPVETPPELGGVLPAMDQEVDEVEVDGKPAILLTSPAEDDDVGVYSVAWEPEPGLSVSVFVYGIDIAAEDVIGVAETVRPATPEEWQALLDKSDEMSGGGMYESEEATESGDGSEPPPPQDTIPEVDPSDPLYDRGWVGSGTSPELSWEAEVEDGKLSIRIEDAESGSSDPVHLSKPFGIASATIGEHMVLAGIIDGNQDVLVEEDGERVEMTWSMELEGNRKLWAAQVGQSRVTATFFGPDGSELTERSFEHATP